MKRNVTIGYLIKIIIMTNKIILAFIAEAQNKMISNGWSDVVPIFCRCITETASESGRSMALHGKLACTPPRPTGSD